ncbi:stress responsive alpha-beta barrel containing protein [Serratia marcescens VGH107]|nr:stress responsive alpha-beta barrel containing protein [Serratia marcescens VGH107]
MIGDYAFTASDYRPGLIRHIVLLKFKSTVTNSQREDIVNRFLSLKLSTRSGEVTPYIVDIESGVQKSGEEMSSGFDYAFIVTFKSEGDRNYYVGRPFVDDENHYDKEHEQLKKALVPLLSEKNGVLVFDFSLHHDNS